MSELLAFGVSHRTAHVAVRERLALGEQGVGALLGELRTDPSIGEAAAVSTCNRTELYLVSDDPVAAESGLLGRLAVRARLRPTELAAIAYTPRNCDAARQLFRVTGGLESMIPGEYEIQGQVRRARDLAREAGTVGPLLDRLFDAALHAGKRVRAETELGSRRVSVASVAADLAARDVGELEGRSVVVVGAGEVAEITAQAMAARGVRTLFVSNRRAERARSLAERFGGRVGTLEELPAELAEADIVVTSTASPHPILGADDVAEVMATRPDRPLVLIDLAVPRDIEHAAADVPGVVLHDIDDLEAVVAANLAGRRAHVGAAEAVVEEEIHDFARWLGHLDAAPTIRDLRRQADAVVASVLADNARRWESASERDRERIAALADAVARRLLHEPTLRLRQLGESGGHGRIEIARELFGLDQATETSAAAEARLPVRPAPDETASCPRAAAPDEPGAARGPSGPVEVGSRHGASARAGGGGAPRAAGRS